VTIRAGGLYVDLVQSYSRLRVIELLRFPSRRVAILALGAESRKYLRFEVAPVAGEALVIILEQETGALRVIEPFGFPIGMAMRAIVLHVVTTEAIFMRIFAHVWRARRGVVTAAATFHLVTIDAGQTEKFDMLAVVECHNSPLVHVFDPVDPSVGSFNVGVETAHNIGLVR
jgi:hypothetical protein